jgi:hypothetical protein
MVKIATSRSRQWFVFNVSGPLWFKDIGAMFSHANLICCRVYVQVFILYGGQEQLMVGMQSFEDSLSLFSLSLSL